MWEQSTTYVASLMNFFLKGIGHFHDKDIKSHNWDINMKVFNWQPPYFPFLITVKYASYQYKSQNWNLGNQVVRNAGSPSMELLLTFSGTWSLQSLHRITFRLTDFWVIVSVHPEQQGLSINYANYVFKLWKSITMQFYPCLFRSKFHSSVNTWKVCLWLQLYLSTLHPSK